MKVNKVLKNQYVFSANVCVYIDIGTDSYRTESSFDVNSQVIDLTSGNIPRDLILSVVNELGILQKQIINQMDVNRDEMTEFLSERKLLSSGHITTDDMIIDNLFNEDESTINL